MTIPDSCRAALIHGCGRRSHLERDVPVADALRKIESVWSRAELCASSHVVLRVPTTGQTVVRSALADQSGHVLTTASGKGVRDQAQASALFELLEHAAGAALLPGSKCEYVDFRDAEPVAHDTISQYAKHFGIERAVAFSRLDEEYRPMGESYLFPAAACDLTLRPQGANERSLARYRSSSGLASGSTEREAYLHAVNEIIERDAVGTALIRATLGTSELRSYSSVEDSLTQAHLSAAREVTGHELFVTTLPSLAGTTAAAYSLELDNAHPLVGYGTSNYGAYAVERALGELLQEAYANLRGLGPEADGGVPDARHLRRYPRMLDAYHLGHPMLNSTHADERMAISVPDETIVSNLERHGLGAYGRTVWRDLETGVHVVQAIVPGAERFHLLKFGYPIAPTGCYGRSVANQLLEGK